MGMSPYGTPKYVDKVYKTFKVDDSSAAFSLNMDYFDFHSSIDRSYSNKFLELFGPQRPAEADFFTMKTNPERASERTAIDENQYYADVAASIQQVTEDALVKICNTLYEKTGQKKLVYAGGVALNTKANWRLLNETPFEEIYIQPAAGDDGGSLGAAMWAYHIVHNQPRNGGMPHAYWGKEYSDAECLSFLQERGIPFERFDDNHEKLTDVMVDALTKETVIGLMQGRFEWGPRALGNRSIIADPRFDSMKEVVNTKIKFREPFRPFAPVILRERAPEYFDYPEVAKHEAPRYMLMVAPFKSDVQDKVQAVCHEGTGRLQSIDRETNELYYDVVKKFGDATGVPVLLNTSFNLRGEPMVTSPKDAFNTFTNSDIDMLVLGSFLVRKKK